MFWAQEEACNNTIKITAIPAILNIAARFFTVTTGNNNSLLNKQIKHLKGFKHQRSIKSDPCVI
jgi:hypothetical protein